MLAIFGDDNNRRGSRTDCVVLVYRGRRPDQTPPFAHATSQASKYPLEAWAPTLKKNLEPLFGPQVFGCPRW